MSRRSKSRKATKSSPRGSGWGYGYSGSYGYSGWGDSYGYTYRRKRSRLRTLAPIMKQMAAYDTARVKLETEGGDAFDLQGLAKILDEPFEVEMWDRSMETALADPGLRKALWDHHDLKIQIRALRNGLPAFYVCQTRDDYWSQYSLVVRDWYRSPGYPVGTDERFVQLMYSGKESYYLRLSHLRAGTLDLLRSDPDGHAGSVDTLMYDVGRHVLAAAWHEDQRPAIVAGQLVPGGLPKLQQALELLYLGLSADLTELRVVSDARVLAFLETVYPQAPIRLFLADKLGRMDGREVNDLPRTALSYYARVGHAFGAFLHTEVPWGLRARPLPFYKVLFANWYTAPRIRDAFEGQESLCEAASRLEKAAGNVIEAMLD